MGGRVCAQEVATRTSIAKTKNRIVVVQPSFVMEGPPLLSFAGAAACALLQRKTCANRFSAHRYETSDWKIKDDKRKARGGLLPAPAPYDKEGCQDTGRCRHLGSRGGEIPCPAPQETPGRPRTIISHAGARAAPGACGAARLHSEA